MSYATRVSILFFFVSSLAVSGELSLTLECQKLRGGGPIIKIKNYQKPDLHAIHASDKGIKILADLGQQEEAELKLAEIYLETLTSTSETQGHLGAPGEQKLISKITRLWLNPYDAYGAYIHQYRQTDTGHLKQLGSMPAQCQTYPTLP